MKRIIKAGAVDQTIDVFIPDYTSDAGAGLTGLVYNSSGLSCYYRKGATGTPTALTLATQTAGGAHSDGGFVAVDGTNMPGVYRLDLSDTIVASAGAVVLMLKGAANMPPVLVELQVVSYDFEDLVNAILGATVESGATVVQSLRLMNSALGAKASGLDTTSVAYRDLADSKNRISATVDANGNRSAVTRDLT